MRSQPHNAEKWIANNTVTAGSDTARFEIAPLLLPLWFCAGPTSACASQLQESFKPNMSYELSFSQRLGNQSRAEIDALHTRIADEFESKPRLPSESCVLLTEALPAAAAAAFFLSSIAPVAISATPWAESNRTEHDGEIAQFSFKCMQLRHLLAMQQSNRNESPSLRHS